jgi:hypothetical protein
VKEGEMGRACSFIGREEKCKQGSGWNARSKETTRKKILKLILDK